MQMTRLCTLWMSLQLFLISSMGTQGFRFNCRERISFRNFLRKGCRRCSQYGWNSNSCIEVCSVITPETFFIWKCRIFYIQICTRKKICVRHLWPKFQFHLFFRETTRDKRFLNLKSQEDNYYFLVTTPVL